VVGRGPLGRKGGVSKGKSFYNLEAQVHSHSFHTWVLIYYDKMSMLNGAFNSQNRGMKDSDASSEGEHIDVK